MTEGVDNRARQHPERAALLQALEQWNQALDPRRQLPRGDQLLIDQSGGTDTKLTSLAARSLRSYFKLQHAVERVTPDALFMKGVDFASLYPDGVTRWQGDLDVCVQSEEDVWRVAASLNGEGFSPVAVTAFRTATVDTGLLLILERPDASLPHDVEKVEVSTHFTSGLIARGVQPHAYSEVQSFSHVVRGFISIFDEYRQQPLRLKDVCDAYILMQSHADRQFPAEELERAISDLGMRRPARALARLLGRCLARTPILRTSRSDEVLDVLAGDNRWVKPNVGAKTLQKWITTAPAEWLRQCALLNHRYSGADRILSRLSSLRMSALRAWSAGLPVFGSRFGENLEARNVTCFRPICVVDGRLLVAETPVGIWVFTASDEFEVAGIRSLTEQALRDGYSQGCSSSITEKGG